MLSLYLTLLSPLSMYRMKSDGVKAGREVGRVRMKGAQRAAPL